MVRDLSEERLAAVEARLYELEISGCAGGAPTVILAALGVVILGLTAALVFVIFQLRARMKATAQVAVELDGKKKEQEVEAIETGRQLVTTDPFIMQESMSVNEEVYEADEDKKFRVNFDLNNVHRMMQDYEITDEYCPVQRTGLEFADGPRLRMVLRQVRQMLGMVQYAQLPESEAEMKAAESRSMKALSRFEVIERSYFLDAIKSDINDVMSRHAEGKLTDPNIAENLDQIRLLGQCLSILDDEIAYLRDVIEREKQQKAITQSEL